MHETQKDSSNQPLGEFEGAGTYAALGREHEPATVQETNSAPEKTAADYIDAYQATTDTTEYYALAREM